MLRILILEAHQGNGVLILEGGVGNGLRQRYKWWANNGIHGARLRCIKALGVACANGEGDGGRRLRLMKLRNIRSVTVAGSGARGCRQQVVGFRVQTLSYELLLDA